MDSANKKGLIAVGITLGIVSLAYYFLVYKGGVGLGNVLGNKNFDLLKDNLGAKANREGVVIVNFNSDKNFAQFYNNNRVIIFNSDKKILIKGSYSDGGKTIVLDGGNEINSGSVWQNLLQTIK